MKDWTPLIEGEDVRLRWYPTRVTIAEGVDKVAWSSGPALFEDTRPQAMTRYRLGAFKSLWHKDVDGRWRVLFDDGVPARPATEEEARSFTEGRAECQPAAAG